MNRTSNYVVLDNEIKMSICWKLFSGVFLSGEEGRKIAFSYECQPCKDAGGGISSFECLGGLSFSSCAAFFM